MAAVRIGRVKLKGGADLRIIDRKVGPHGESWSGKIIENARGIASYDQPGCELVGYFIIGMFSDGSYSDACRYDHDRSPIPRRLMPAYVAEIVRETLITKKIAEDTAVEIFNQGPIG